jgi:hypothetical protein
LTEWFGRAPRKREQRVVTPEEGWRLLRASAEYPIISAVKQ